MTTWWIFFILCNVLSYMESSSLSPFVQKNKYNNSFRFTKSTRTRLNQILRIYKKEWMGNIHFEDRSRHLKDLPSLSTDFSSWLLLPDWERLHKALWDMQAYWNMLERKRRHLENEQRSQTQPGDLLRKIRHIQLDLRDLMNQVSSQMKTLKSSWNRPKPTPVWLLSHSSARTVWDSRVEGYIILRDLDLYLTKLARDFLLLASKTHL